MFKMSNEVYDILKEIALTILPASVDALLGACLHVSTADYWKEGDTE